MKNYLTIIHVLALLSLTQCNESEGHSTEKKDADDTSHSSTTVVQHMAPDTSYDLTIDGVSYTLTLTRDEFHSVVDSSFQTITVRLINQKLQQVIFVETKDYNEIDGLKEIANGCYQLTLVSSAGGSGFSGTVFQVRTKPHPGLQTLLNFNELSTWKTSKDGKTLLAFEGIWNMNTEEEEPESHFSEHRQAITLYTVQADTVVAKEVGTTEKKYDFYDDATFSAFRKAEPLLAGKINWSEFE